MAQQHDQAAGVRLEAIDAIASQIPTEQPESDGTLASDATRCAAPNLRPDMARPGLGLELKRADAERYAVA